MLRKSIQFVILRRFWVVLTIVLITVLLGMQVKNLKIMIDSTSMLPKDHPNVIGTNLAESLFGSKHVVVVGVSAADGGQVYRKETLEAVTRLTDALSKVPGVKPHTMLSVAADRAKAISGEGDELRVERMLPPKFTESDISALKAKLADNPIFNDILVSKDGTVASVSFSVKTGQGGFREVLDRVNDIVNKERSDAVKINLSGTTVFFAAVERFAQRIGILFPIALVIIALLHFEAFRTVQGLILPLVTAILAVVWGLGIMGLANVSMDAFNATTPILILAVAAGHAVQILKRYYEEYAGIVQAEPTAPLRASSDKAILESLTKVAPVMMTAGAVAAIGFFSLVTFNIATIRTFGVFTGLGILSALLIELTFIPALRSYLPPPKPQAVVAKPKVSRWDRVAASISGFILQRPKSILAGFFVIAAVSSVGIMHVNTENSTKSYFGESLPVRADDRFLNEKLAGTNTLYVVFQGNRADHMKDPEVLRAIEQTQRYIETLPHVGKTVSIVDFVKQMNRSMNGGKASAHVLPTSSDMISQYLLLYSMSGQPTDFDAYIDYDYKNANLIVWMKNDSSKYSASMVKAIRDYVQPILPKGTQIQIGGSVPQSSALSETLVSGKIKNIAQIILVVFIAGVVVFRSLLAGIYLIVPLVVTVLVNFGVMGLTGIPLNTPNSVNSAMAIGIGADYAIYLIYRMREEWIRAGGDIDFAVRETMRTAGKAVFYVATAIAGGYSVLMLSFNFYVHIWFGILIVMSMIVSATAALLLVPTLLKAFPPRFMRTGTAAMPKQATTVISCLLAVCIWSLATSEAKAGELNVDDLMEKSYQATRVDSSLSEATFRLRSASGQERVRKTFGATRLSSNRQDNRRTIRFLSPGDVRNTTTLLVEHTGKDDEIWVYLPTLKKARRLASNNKKSSFVGTDLSYGDIAGHKAQDWSHTLIRQEAYQGMPVYVVESVPKTAVIADNSGYSKRVSWVSKENFVALRVDSYDHAGNLLKTAENTEVKLVDPVQKKWQAMLIKVKNHQTDHTTVVQLDKFQANINVSEDYFSVRYLEKEE